MIRRRDLLTVGRKDYSQEYFAIVAKSDGNIKFSGTTSGSTTNTLQYSTDGGTNWSTALSNITISVNSGDAVMFKGTCTPSTSNPNYGIGTFNGTTANFNVKGNIMSLLYGNNFRGQTSLSGKRYAFYNLFNNCTSLVSAENLLLPATTLANACYSRMFYRCSNLTTAPILPATTLVGGCYKEMFFYCTSLTAAPTLPSTTLATYCYELMFKGCSSLTTAPTLPATTLATNCYNEMFYNCSSLTAAPTLPATTLANNCYQYMFNGCSSLETVPTTLPATTLRLECYNGMFLNCTSLTTAPILPATTLTSSCYRSMFSGCTSLTTAPELPATTLADLCYVNMFDGCNNLTTAPELPAETLVDECYELMFKGCTSLTTAPELSATTLASACYYEMFKNCSNLSSITCLATDISATNCTTNWVNGVAVSGTFTKAKSMTGWTTGTNGIPNGWTVHNKTNYLLEYFTIESLADSNEIKMQRSKTPNNPTLSYSLDDGETWTTTTISGTKSFGTINTGDKIIFKGTNTRFATAWDAYNYFNATKQFKVYGNVMSLINGDDFISNSEFDSSTTHHCVGLFRTTYIVDASNLILPALTLYGSTYNGMFRGATALQHGPKMLATTPTGTESCSSMFEGCINLEEPIEINFTTLAQQCCMRMFCMNRNSKITTPKMTKSPILRCQTAATDCYSEMFKGNGNLNEITCLLASVSGTTNWVQNAGADTGTFYKNPSATWSTGASGIPATWMVKDGLTSPTISFDGFSVITLSCETEGANIFYKLNNTGDYSAYTTAIVISEDTFIETYAELDSETSSTASQTCVYVSDIPIEYSNRDLKKWQYGGQEITTPYSVNAVDGHSSSYAKGIFNFETSFALKEAEPTYLWFQHADQSAEIYVDDTLVEKHWGGYAAFTTDISSHVHSGVNNIKVALKNNEGNNLAPASGDFNLNATLGNVRLLTSPYVPAMNYGYDGFHITSTVSNAEATMNIKTSVPTGATLVCKIDDGNTNIYSATSASTGEEITFTKVISNPHLWNGTLDPHMYTVTLEIYGGNDLYHRFVRPYGLRYYEYVINDTEKVGTVSEPYTGFLLNGAKYLLRGCCMHDDIDGKANALNETDYDTTFATIRDLGLNFLRLAHYPHPKEVYDRCDALGIIVQTEAPCVNNLKSTMPDDYYEHLTGQYTDMVNQHYNHPCIVFWGLGNETSTDSTSFGKLKVEQYTALIKSLDTERLVGYVLAQAQNSSATGPSGYYDDPQGVDWFGCNMYVGWYQSTNTNNPSSEIQKRLDNTVARIGKPIAFSEYGGGGTSTCHSDDFDSTTTRGKYPRHDIECLMWVHEGHIAAIKNFPQLISTSQWQLFDIAVASRNEGFTECLDGDNTSINDNLRYLNNKGLVERDHVTRKDPFYLYKAWWNPTPFVHICQKNFTRRVGRTIKCYSNDGDTFKLYVNGILVDTATATDNIVLFAPRTFNNGDAIKVSGSTSTDEFIMPDSPLYDISLTVKYNVTDTTNPTIIGGSGYALSFKEIEIDGVKQQDVVSAYTFSTTGEHTVKYKLDNTSIDAYALSGCSNIVSIDIPNDVTMLKNGCFKNCTSLSSVTMSNNITLIENSVFKGCSSLLNVTIPNSVTSIGEVVFSGCTSLESISIGSGITNFNINNLNGCYSITSITVDSNNTVYDSRNNSNAIIKSDTNELIVGCQSTIIPNSVTTIGNDAFRDCTSLTSIDIPNSVTKIGGDVFRGCSSLTSCTIGSGVTSIGTSVFRDCSRLTSIDIPNSVTKIGNYSFANCTNLTSIDIPSGVTKIDEFVFYQCRGLTSVTIPDSVTSIGKNAFDGCISLTSIDIPSGVTSIGNNAFSSCSSLTSITSYATTAPTISSGTFQNVKTDGTLYVPQGSSGYDTWMQNANYYLGKYNWTKVEQ